MQSIEVQGVHLSRIGNTVEVRVQTMDGKWRTVLSEDALIDLTPGYSHIVEPSGIASAPEHAA